MEIHKRKVPLPRSILREAGTEKESCRQKSADGGGKHGQNLTIQRRQGGQSGSGDIGTTGGEAQSGLCTPNPGSCRKNPLLVCHALQFVDDFRSSLHIWENEARGEGTSLKSESLLSAPSKCGWLYQKGLRVPGVEDLEHQAKTFALRNKEPWVALEPCGHHTHNSQHNPYASRGLEAKVPHSHVTDNKS